MPLQKISLITLFTLAAYYLSAQTLDAGITRDQHQRDLQLLGRGNADQSFTLRSIPFGIESDTVKGSFKKPLVTVLPLSWLTQFNSRQPFSENDGSLIAAKGLQTRLSGGVQVRAGFVEMQLAPELLWAANPAYPVTASYGYNSGKSFQRIYPGQSTIQLVAGGFRAGVSTANQWWGPGVRNSLLMT